MKKLFFLASLSLATATTHHSLFCMEQQLAVENTAECSICADNLDDGQQVATLHCVPDTPPHQYHFNCLRTWCIEQNAEIATCPLCRTTIKYNDMVGSLSILEKGFLASNRFVRPMLTGFFDGSTMEIEFEFGKDAYWKKFALYIATAYFLPTIRNRSNQLLEHIPIPSLTPVIRGAILATNPYSTILLLETATFLTFRTLGYSTNFFRRTTTQLATRLGKDTALASYSQLSKMFDLDIELERKLDGNSLVVGNKILETMSLSLGVGLGLYFKSHIQDTLERLYQISAGYIANSLLDK